MSDKTSLGDRMKRYEDVNQHFLLRRTPVIIRIDGKAFHSFTKGMEKPFDKKLMDLMKNVSCQLVNDIEGCLFAYTQSDEISLLLTDYKTINTQPYFDYKLQKLASVISSMATAWFNFGFINMFSDHESYPLAYFDARAFNIPRDEVVNYYVWRQQDCTRNSIQSVGRSLYSQKQLHGKNCDEIQEMVFKTGKNWNDYSPSEKRGTAIYKKLIEPSADDPASVRGIIRTKAFIDDDTPVFTQNRNYIQQWVDIDHD